MWERSGDLPQKLDQVIEISSEGIWSVDADGRTDFINERGAAILGYRPEEIIGRPAMEFTMPGANDDDLLKDIRTYRLNVFELCMRHKDDSAVWIQGSARPSQDEAGGYKGALVAYIDITERKMDIERLRKSEERYRALITASSSLVFRASGDWTEMIEVTGGEVGPDRWGPFSSWLQDHIYPEDRPSIQKALGDAVRERRMVELEHRVRYPNGEERWFLSRAVPMLDSEGNITEWFGTAKDITKRKRAEEALSRSEQRFELLSEANSILLSSRDPENVIQSIAGKVLRYLDCDMFFSYILDEASGRLRLNAYYGVSRQAAREIEWLELGTAVCGCVARDGRYQVLEDIQNSDDNHASLLRSLGVQAYACHPIHIGTRTIGTLSFGTRDRLRFKADELSLMRIVAEQISVSIKRKRAEVALRDREKHLAMAQKLAHIGSWAWDIVNDKFYVSDEGYRLFGLEPQSMTLSYADFLSFVHPDDQARVADQGRLADRQEYDENTYRIVRKDGQERHVHVQGTAVYGNDGRPLRAVGTIQDITDSELLNEALRDREEHLARAQSIAHIGSWDWDIDRDQIYFSDETYRIAGAEKTKAFVSNAEALAMVHPQDRELVSYKAAMAFENGAYEIEYRIIRKDGELRTLRDIGEVVIGRDGRKKLVGTLQDITERRRAEEMLRTSEERFRTLAEASPAAVIVYREGRCMYVNNTVVAMTGYSREDLLSMSVLNLIHPDYRDEVRNWVERRGGSNHTSARYEAKGIHKSGEEGWIDISSAAIDYDGFPAGLVIFFDVTDRKRAEEALKEKEARISSILESSQDVIYQMDVETGRFTFISPAIRSIIGLPVEEVRRWDVDDAIEHIHPEDRATARSVKLDPKPLGTQGTVDYRAQHVDGTYRWVSDRFKLVLDPNSGRRYIEGTLRDVTDLKRVEIDLRESHQRYRALIETNVDFIWEMDPQGKYTYCSPQMETLWGLDPQSMLGRTPFDLMPPETRDQMLGHFIEAASNPRGFKGLRTVSYDARGNLVQLETSAVPFFDDQGKLLGFRGITRDITAFETGGQDVLMKLL